MVKKILKIIVNLVFAFVVLFFLAGMASSFFGFKSYVVQSGSMEPVIQTGSMAIVNENASYDDVQVGDIIAFQSATGDKVTHRVIAITDEGMETKGDANDMSDGVSTTRSNFVGITVTTIPQLGYFMASLSTTNGRIILISCILALLFLSLLLDYDDKEEKKEKGAVAENVEETASTEQDTLKKSSGADGEDGAELELSSNSDADPETEKITAE
jgi:signal peptidase